MKLSEGKNKKLYQQLKNRLTTYFQVEPDLFPKQNMLLIALGTLYNYL